MSVKARFMYEEDDDDSGNQSDADSLRSLYAGHEVDDDMVVGPVEIRRPVVGCKYKAPKTSPAAPRHSHACKTCQSENIKHYTCSECDLQVFAKAAILSHLRKHKRPPTTCKVCHKTFKYEHILTKHMIRHSKEKKFACCVCHKAYKHMSSLSVHKCKNTKKPFSCDHCKKSFAFKGQLQTHIRLHTGDKPYKCEICSRGFAQQTSLNNHVLKHKGIKPHQCEFCKNRFRQVSNLKKHIDMKHPDKRDCHKKARKRSIVLTWFSCKNCHIVFSDSDKINKHMESCR